MSNVDNRLNEMRSIENSITSRTTELLSLMKGGGPTGGGSGLEPRVARLEGRVDKIGDDLSTVKTDVATIKENVRHLPTKSFIVTGTLTALTIFAAIALFLDKIRIVFGLGAGVG